MLVTAVPCRLQNDSPPNSINPSEDSGIDVDSKIADDWQSTDRGNTNDVQSIPPSVAKNIDESNYVKLSSLTAALSNAALGKGASDKQTESIGCDKVNEVDGKANLLNNLYHVNSNHNQALNAYNAKAILSIVNQKNINNLNNLLNKTNHGCINSNKTNECVAETKSGLMLSNADFNKNGLPTPNTIVPNIDTAKLNGNFNRNSQTYVIQPIGNGAANGNELAPPTKGK